MNKEDKIQTTNTRTLNVQHRANTDFIHTISPTKEVLNTKTSCGCSASKVDADGTNEFGKINFKINYSSLPSPKAHQTMYQKNVTLTINYKDESVERVLFKLTVLPTENKDVTNG